MIIHMITFTITTIMIMSMHTHMATRIVTFRRGRSLWAA